MIFMIDNYDSFTYNLVQYFQEMGNKVLVRRNDAVSTREIEKARPDYLVISPGPGVPQNAGVSVEAIRTFAGKLPIFGVCLGHQAIGFAFGGRIDSAARLMHGKVSRVRHDGKRIYQGLENPFPATRYHSLAIRPKELPSCLKVTATSEDGEIMGVRHKRLAIEGVQFHPESILTTSGKTLLKNFLETYAPG
jgi:para-aminobenzoate synthetase component 2